MDVLNAARMRLAGRTCVPLAACFLTFGACGGTDSVAPPVGQNAAPPVISLAAYDTTFSDTLISIHGTVTGAPSVDSLAYDARGPASPISWTNIAIVPGPRVEFNVSIPLSETTYQIVFRAVDHARRVSVTQPLTVTSDRSPPRIKALLPIYVQGGSTERIAVYAEDMASQTAHLTWHVNGGAEQTSATSYGARARSEYLTGYRSVTNADVQFPAGTDTLSGGVFDGPGNRTPLRGVVIAGTRVTDVAVGYNHWCSLLATGVVTCWGDNSTGQLGDGTTINRAVPVAVSGGRTYRALAAGIYHTCAITTVGDAYCWGAFDRAAFPAGAFPSTSSNIPRLVASGLHFRSVASRGNSTCALTDGGAAYCWGSNNTGQLGDGGAEVWSDQPVAVAGGLTFTALTVGTFHACALTADGAAYCWGESRLGELGNGSITPSSIATPVRVNGGLTFSSISAGGQQTCGVTTDFHAYCWGYGGSAGTGTALGPVALTAPTAVVGGLSFKSVAAGSEMACGITTSGATYCWGVSTEGQMGTNMTNPGLGFEVYPLGAAGGLTFSTLSAAVYSVCGVTPTGALFCWGSADPYGAPILGSGS